MKKLFSVLPHAMLIASLVQPQNVLAENFSASTADVTENVSNVLQVFCGNGESTEVSGSGVVIGTTSVLTNAHVITDENDEYYEWCYGAWSTSAYMVPSQWVWLQISEFVRFDDSFDYAFLTPYDSDGTMYEFDSYATVANGDSMSLSEEVTVMGYPGTSTTITTTSGTISGFQGTTWVKTDARIDAGNSGGAAFDVMGNLFGIPTAVSGIYSSTLGWVQNINAILEDAFGEEIAIRDYTTLYTTDNVFCLQDTCYNYAPDEDTWDTPTGGEEMIDVPDEEEIVTIDESTDESTDEGSDLTYDIPDHAQYSSERFDSALQTRLKGHILLQTQQHGEAWYVHPDDGMRYYMRDGDIAYQMMRSFGLGITDADLAKIPSVDEAADMLSVASVCSSNSTAKRLSGKILLQVQQHGEAWYIHPTLCYRIYLKDGAAAYDTMRYLSLGVSDENLAKLPFSSTMTFK